MEENKYSMGLDPEKAEKFFRTPKGQKVKKSLEEFLKRTQPKENKREVTPK